MSLPIYKIELGDAEGIVKMSLVDYPAVESDFIKFSKEEPIKFSIQSEEEHIVFGCAMRADYPIYRNEYGKEFYVIFTKDVIKELYTKFMIDGCNNVNLEHSQDVNDCYLIQSFIKDVENGISPKNFEEIEDGSWFVSYKILNDAVWNKVKDGTFNGFSIEGYFNLTDDTDEIDELVDSILN